MPSLALLGLVAILAVADPLSGGAGWIGAGLLGLVLGWLLLIHLPAKDKILKEYVDLGNKVMQDLIVTKDKQQEALIERQAVRMQYLTDAFGLDLKLVIDHCREEVDKSIEQFRRGLKDSQELILQQKVLIDQQRQQQDK